MYQSLNIIGSFTAGTTSVQQQVHSDKSRSDAYRSLLKDQMQHRNPADPDTPISKLDTDRITIGDAPEEERNPPHMARVKQSPRKTKEGGGADESSSVPILDDDGPGSIIDTVI